AVLLDPDGGARLLVGPARAGAATGPVPAGGAHPVVARAAVAVGAGSLRRGLDPGPRGPRLAGHARVRPCGRRAGRVVPARAAQQRGHAGTHARGVRRGDRQVGRAGRCAGVAGGHAHVLRAGGRRGGRRRRAHGGGGASGPAMVGRAAGAQPCAAEGTALMAARMKVVLALMFTVLALYTVRLMYLQLVMGQEYVARSEQNAMQEERILPLRGRILARDGTVLADDRVAYDLLYEGGEIPDWDRLKALLGLTGDPRPPDPTKPEEVQHGAVLAWNIPDELVPAVEERVALSLNLALRERVERTYPTNLAAQTIGYTSQADPQRNPGYSSNDLVGVMGIEASYESVLFGSSGQRRVEVDHRGTEIASQVLWSATPGRDVVLTLDPHLQRLAEDVLADSLRYVNEDRVR